MFPIPAYILIPQIRHHTSLSDQDNIHFYVYCTIHNTEGEVILDHQSLISTTRSLCREIRIAVSLFCVLKIKEKHIQPLRIENIHKYASEFN